VAYTLNINDQSPFNKYINYDIEINNLIYKPVIQDVYNLTIVVLDEKAYQSPLLASINYKSKQFAVHPDDLGQPPKKWPVSRIIFFDRQAGSDFDSSEFEREYKGMLDDDILDKVGISDSIGADYIKLINSADFNKMFSRNSLNGAVDVGEFIAKMHRVVSATTNLIGIDSALVYKILRAYIWEMLPKTGSKVELIIAKKMYAYFYGKLLDYVYQNEEEQKEIKQELKKRK
jgi:hypothetical protein